MIIFLYKKKMLVFGPRKMDLVCIEEYCFALYFFCLAVLGLEPKAHHPCAV